MTGSSTDAAVVAAVSERTAGKRTMVILDSAHDVEHVLRELEAYGPLVSPGCYLIVEDTNLGGHPIEYEFPGPMVAVIQFVARSDGFEVDRDREKFYLTFNPSGYLRKLA